MKRTVLILGILLSLGAIAFADPGLVDYSSHGFTIRELTSADSSENSIVLEMLLPPTDGFAANLNVIIQHYNDTMAAYRKLTEEQIQKVGFTLIRSQIVDPNEIRMEYSGTQNGRELHWLQRAVKSGSRVYLVTATALAAQWDANSANLTGAVDSLRLTR